MKYKSKKKIKSRRKKKSLRQRKRSIGLKKKSLRQRKRSNKLNDGADSKILGDCVSFDDKEYIDLYHGLSKMESSFEMNLDQLMKILGKGYLFPNDALHSKLELNLFQYMIKVITERGNIFLNMEQIKK